MNGKQFYKDDYKTRDYGTLMHEYEKKLEHKQKIEMKKRRLRRWSEEDQLFEDSLWAS